MDACLLTEDTADGYADGMGEQFEEIQGDDSDSESDSEDSEDMLP